jgi:uncharacterized protein YcsI (UPF0317 family)
LTQLIHIRNRTNLTNYITLLRAFKNKCLKGTNCFAVVRIVSEQQNRVIKIIIGIIYDQYIEYFSYDILNFWAHDPVIFKVPCSFRSFPVSNCKEGQNDLRDRALQEQIAAPFSWKVTEKLYTIFSEKLAYTDFFT